MYRQLRTQADGLCGNLDKVWPDIKDSGWTGGEKEGWERVPYWLDGFIPMAWLLDDSELKACADKYINAILSRQQEDGWICPCDKKNVPAMISGRLFSSARYLWFITNVRRMRGLSRLYTRR